MSNLGVYRSPNVNDETEYIQVSLEDYNNKSREIITLREQRDELIRTGRALIKWHDVQAGGRALKHQVQDLREVIAKVEGENAKP